MTREGDRKDVKSANKLVQTMFFLKKALSTLRKLCNFENIYRMLILDYEGEVRHMCFSHCNAFCLRKDYKYAAWGDHVYIACGCFYYKGLSWPDFGNVLSI